MKVKVTKVKDAKIISKVEDEIANVLFLCAVNLLADLKLSTKKHLDKTLQHANPRPLREKAGQEGFGDAVVTHTKDIIKKTKFGATISLTTIITNRGTKTPHDIWHNINKGYPSYTPTSSFTYPLRKKRRTTKGNLSVNPFTGYTGEFRRATPNKTIKGLEGREWYVAALKEVKDEVIKPYEKLFKFTREEANNG